MPQNRNAAADEARGIPELTKLGGTVVPGNSPPTKKAQAIFAELIGSDRCSALGITARSTAPVLALCRALLEAGYDPSLPLHVYRGDVLALKIRSIDEGAQLMVGDSNTGKPVFRRWQDRAAMHVAVRWFAKSLHA